ncbi:MAG: hypothetical protein KJ814_01815 [Proteobacteria bacterium]|nr:hypothetical protein [Pseudomonadota bacterium]
MKTDRTITLEIPEDMAAELANFKRRSNITDTRAAVFELLKYALTLPPYFRNFDWEKAEAEADADIAAGRVECFTSVEDLLADLKA